ncbi:TRAP transporter TatT component family protein [Luteitalea sp. TBR-22]|uniref:TRAP transporter TatT component family protein n=1 Tax=Luteitalea sp. TBR-22 TaxID=2802971 RepID=UPI001EF69A5F|nr:TRAP transporter TatT component family protein [Luteitalea sp. TBR-22]
MALCVDAALAAQVPASADALFARREDPVAARQAADQYLSHHRASPQDFVGAWKLARVSYFMGTQGPAGDRRMWLETGLAAANDAIALNQARPEGHFWLAANMGALAESYGLRQGLKYRTRIRQALERVLAIDPAFMEGSADRALGRWYHKVPGLFGGSAAKAEQHLRKSLTYNPQSTVSLFFLAELYADEGRPEEARRLLQQVLETPVHKEWAAEDRAYKAQALERLRSLSSRR